MTTSFDGKTLLNTRGLKATDTRLAVLTLLSESKLPLDVRQIEEYLSEKNIDADQVTVYRILEALVTRKIIKRIDFQEGKFRYEMARDDHHHLICEHCGTVQDMTDCPVEPLETYIGSKQHFLVKHHALEFFGLCANCR